MNLVGLLYSIIILPSLLEKAQSKIIKKWDDVEEFAGKVIAYSAVSGELTDYFLPRDECPRLIRKNTNYTDFDAGINPEIVFAKISTSYKNYGYYVNPKYFEYRLIDVPDLRAYEFDIIQFTDAKFTDARYSETIFSNYNIEKVEGGIDMRLATEDEKHSMFMSVLGDYLWDEGFGFRRKKENRSDYYFEKVDGDIAMWLATDDVIIIEDAVSVTEDYSMSEGYNITGKVTEDLEAI